MFVSICCVHTLSVTSQKVGSLVFGGRRRSTIANSCMLPDCARDVPAFAAVMTVVEWDTVVGHGSVFLFWRRVGRIDE